jgi:hypothetical protein
MGDVTELKAVKVHSKQEEYILRFKSVRRSANVKKTNNGVMVQEELEQTFGERNNKLRCYRPGSCIRYTIKIEKNRRISGQDYWNCPSANSYT